MDSVKNILIILIVAIGLVFFVYKTNNDYNSELHNNDIQLSEWISPDGVHYWYYKYGYQAMLAPRYDSDGNLIIDKEIE